MPYIITFVVSLAACIGLQALALHVSGGRFAKNESNFFSSIGRIQAGTVGKPEVMMLGSSITGRLPDRAQGFVGFANMGCDGGSAVDTLRAIDAGILPDAPVILVEVNTLPLSLTIGPSEVGAAMKRPWFGVGMKIPALSAYARPSGYFYSYLLARRAGDYGDPMSENDLKIISVPHTPDRLMSAQMSKEEDTLKNELIGITRRLKQRGCAVVYVWLPPGRGEGRIPDWVHSLIVESEALWWDMGNEVDPSLITLTDSVHMAAPSAARTVISLKKGLFKR